jgi:signal transduction histidine kinase
VVSGIGRARAWTRAHPLVADAALAAALLGAAIVSSDLMRDLFKADPTVRLPSAVLVVACLAAMIAPLALRRRAPLTVLVACTAAFVALAQVTGPEIEPTITAIAISLAFYSAAAYGRPDRRNLVCGICVVVVMALTVIELAAAPFASELPVLYFVFAVLVNLALFCAMWALGAALGSGRRRAGELLERTVELEREREENARRAVFDERVRIARELHDVVAHHVSMMGVQAGAGRVVIDRDPGKAKQAMAAIEGSSRAAVSELHRLLGFLRQAGDPDDLSPQPGLGQLERLASSMRESDLAVAVRVEGEPRALSPTVDVSAYRIVQEALTNTLKHAGASHADVHLRFWPGELEVEIVDDGRPNGAASPTAGGLGLIGMRERAALHGGQLTAGPTAGGGFSVRARLPTPDGAL